MNNYIYIRTHITHISLHNNDISIIIHIIIHHNLVKKLYLLILKI